MIATNGHRVQLSPAAKRQGKRADLTSRHGDEKLSPAEKLAAEYGVSERTIRRDAIFARDLDAIAEVSIEAKQIILAGRAKVPRKVLHRIAESSPIERKLAIDRALRGEYQTEPQRADLRKSVAAIRRIVGTLKDSFPRSEWDRIVEVLDTVSMEIHQ